MTIKPLSPDDDRLKQKNRVPDNVIAAVNSVIIEHWDGYESRFKLKELATAVSKETGISESELYRLHYLDIEGIYSRGGWNVVYRQPAFNESFDETFQFTKKQVSLE